MIYSQIPVNLTGRNVRHDYIYIDDFIDACVRVMSLQKDLSGKIFNIGTGREYTNEEVVYALFRIAKKSVPIKRGGYEARQWDGDHWVADMSQTKRILEWKPEYDLYRGLKATYDWLLRHRSQYEIKA